MPSQKVSQFEKALSVPAHSSRVLGQRGDRGARNVEEALQNADLSKNSREHFLTWIQAKKGEDTTGRLLNREPRNERVGRGLGVGPEVGPEKRAFGGSMIEVSSIGVRVTGHHPHHARLDQEAWECMMQTLG